MLETMVGNYDIKRTIAEWQLRGIGLDGIGARQCFSIQVDSYNLEGLVSGIKAASGTAQVENLVSSEKIAQ